MGSINCIDDVIAVSRGAKRISDLAPIVTLIAEILLISTSRQIRRMFTPLAEADLFIWDPQKNKAFLKRFNVSNRGVYHVYSMSCDITWHIDGNMEDSQAAQMVFHSIFGTYEKDLGAWNKSQIVKNGTPEVLWELPSDKLLHLRGDAHWSCQHSNIIPN